MSLSFHVAAPELPSFHAVVAASGTVDPIQLNGAGWTGEPWPKGLYPKIVDAASAPSRLELTRELEATFARAGVHGSFIAWTRGAARGVVVARIEGALAFHVPVLASPADYLLAAGLAAGAARLAKTTVTVDDPGAPEGAGQSLAPDALLAHWTEAAAEAHARQVGTWLADDVVQGRTYFFQGPRGFVALAPNDLAVAPDGERFDRARAILIGEDAVLGLSRAPAPPGEQDRRDAVLLTSAMVYAAGADGVLADAEARQLEAQLATVRELRAFPARALMDAVRTEVSGLDALGELATLALRRKAFVLAAEVIASARDGKLGGEASDPNVEAVSAIAKALRLDDDQVFLAQVVRTASAKYEDAKLEDDQARSLALGMLLAAAADGHVDEAETAVLAALARTVPDLRARDVAAVFGAAKTRMGDGLDAALSDLSSLTRCRNKCFALATEVALIAGKAPDATLLPRLRASVAPDSDYADAAIATFAAKYA